MVAAMDVTGNPSSVHGEGRRARALVEEAREEVAALVGATPAEVVFTSGATEANNWVLAAGWDTIFLSQIEHDSVLAPARASGVRLVDIPASVNGVASLDSSAQAPAGRGLLTLQMANNETGVIQPVRETAAIARARGLVVHTDATQAAGRVPVSLTGLGVDLLSLSSHKIGGPKGIGALVVRDGTAIASYMRGGGQERRRRAGTENVAAIAGFGAAARAALADLANVQRVAGLRDELESGLKRLTPELVVVGASAPRLPNTTCVAWPARVAETLVIKLDLAGIAVGAGAACSSGKVGASHVLEAMGLAPGIARSAIRISIGPTTSREDVERLLSVWTEITTRRAIDEHVHGSAVRADGQRHDRALEEV